MLLYPGPLVVETTSSGLQMTFISIVSSNPFHCVMLSFDREQGAELEKNIS